MAVVEVQARSSGTGRRTLLFLCVLAAVVLFFVHLDLPLLEPEEALYAEVPREMLAAGSWLVPVHRGQPYYEKPPLFSWLIMASYGMFGIHEWAARLVPCTVALATVIVAFWWGRRMFGFRAGLLGAMVLCLSPRFVHQGRMIAMDGLLCLCVTAALALGQQAQVSERLRWRYWLLSAAACGIGLLTKGPTALILTVLPLLVYQLLTAPSASRRVYPGGAAHGGGKPRRSLLGLSARLALRNWLAYLAVASVVALPWYAAMTWRDPAFLHDFFWTHHVLLRFVQPMHDEPFWFYLPVLPLGMLPWSLLFVDLVKFTRPRALKTLKALKAWAAGSPLSPVLGGEGSGVRGLATARFSPPHPCPSPPEYRGRGETKPPVSSDLASSGRLLTEVRFLLASCLWCLLFFSVADCKRIGYMLPAMPGLALALGYALDRRLDQGGRLPFWITLGVLAAGCGGAILAFHTELLGKGLAIFLVVLPLAALGWILGRRRTPRFAWATCGVATFAVLFTGIFFIAPSYYHRFSMCDEIRSAASESRLPVVCYPHHWDSINYYLRREDVRVYDRASRAQMLTNLENQPETLVFVKSGPALKELLSGLSDELEFVTCGKARTVTAGLVRRRGPMNFLATAPTIYFRAASNTSATATENSGFRTDFAASPRR